MRQRPKLKAWLVESFAGARHGERIYWDLSNPDPDFDGEYRPGNADRPLTIRITDRKQLSGFERLAVVVFEVCNSESAALVVDATKRAHKGELNREQFAREIIMTEFYASMKCKTLLIQHAIPYENHPSVANLLCLPHDFSGFWAQLRHSAAAEKYRRFYDRVRPKSEPTSQSDQPQDYRQYGVGHFDIVSRPHFRSKSMLLMMIPWFASLIGYLNTPRTFET